MSAADPARRRAGLLAAAFGCLLVSPLVWLDGLWGGPALIAAGIDRDVVWVAAGALFLAVALLPPALLLAAWRFAFRPAAGRTLPVVLVLIGLIVALGPFHRVSLLSWLPGGRWLLVLIGIIAAERLIRAGRRAAPTHQQTRRTARGASLLVVAVMVGIGAWGAIVGAGGDRIPLSPSGMLLADFDGTGPITGAPLDATRPPGFGGLLPGQGSNIHNDPGMTDAYYGRSVIDSEKGEIRTFRAMADCASILFDGSGNMTAVCVSATGTSAHLLDPDSLDPLASRRLSSRPLRADLLTNFAGGGYAVLDRAGRLIVPSAEGKVDRFRLDFTPGAEAIEPAGSIDVAPGLQAGETITSVLPESGRRWWYVGSGGTVGTIDPVAGRVRSLRSRGTDIENSFALAPGGGVFVVDSRELMRLDAGPDGAPVKVWAEPYDAGDRRKPGQTSRASGTTPTVMAGGDLVAITDNADPRMNVQVFRASPKVAGDRLFCSVPVFGDGASATENSLIAAGDALFVENNYGYRLPSLIGGHSSEPGAARIDLDRHSGTCRLTWESDEARIPSVVSKVSVDDGLMLTYTKPDLATGIDAWYFTGVDAATGKVLWRRLAGTGPLANNHYAALYPGPSGSLYVGTLGGVIGLTPGARP